MTLVLDELVVEVDEFETADPALRGEMTITLIDADGGADLVACTRGCVPVFHLRTTRPGGANR